MQQTEFLGRALPLDEVSLELSERPAFLVFGVLIARTELVCSASAVKFEI